MTSRTHQGSGDPADGLNADDASGHSSPDEPDFDELRQILIGPEFAALDDLTSRIEQPARFSQDVARVLPEAIARRAAQDDRLAAALTPTIEQAVRTSVRKDSHVLVDALFPVMGPAIRKAVASALGEMIQSLNRSMEHSFTVKGIKWRLEAWRTGKSFAEVVLLHSLVYRVEQVFLFHTETGLLLQHIVAPSVEPPDADLFSAMLNAIQDFIRDAVGIEAIDAVRFGDLKMMAERGPLASVVGMVRGAHPKDLRTVFQVALEAIHRDYGASLERFDGDATVFDGARPILEECFQARYETEEKKVSPALIVVVSAVALLLLLWGGYAWWQSHKWNGFITRLKAEPGVVVTDAGTSGGKYFVTGLKDPLAADPTALLADEHIAADDVVFRWEPYHSFQQQFLVERARPLLAPPSTVQLSAANGELVVTGIASHAWIVEARRLVQTMPGVTGLDEKGLVDRDFQDLLEVKGRMESIVLKYVSDTTTLVAGQERELDMLEKTLGELRAVAAKRGVTIGIEIVGHTDSTGTEDTNVRLSEDRATELVRMLDAKNIDTTGIKPYGVATAQPLRAENGPEDAALNRSVTFKVSIQEKEP
ncbi:MAG TPA: OmpA family protein [Blastocatellia bacterium]|nr:OmpA family protein [Blastocatellia bacterium]